MSGCGLAIIRVIHRCGRLGYFREPPRFVSGHVAADSARIDIEWSELETYSSRLREDNSHRDVRAVANSGLNRSSSNPGAA
jgi:hypothetical protein